MLLKTFEIHSRSDLGPLNAQGITCSGPGTRQLLLVTGGSLEISIGFLSLVGLWLASVLRNFPTPHRFVKNAQKMIELCGGDTTN